MKQFLKAFVKLDSSAERFKRAKENLISSYNSLEDDEKIVVNSTPMDIDGLEYATVGEYVAGEDVAEEL